ncbi:MAG: S-layer protein [Candidatus Peribacteria bacterium]|nr:S-layer protein [Candidatus Peribacteria bacterium]
MGVRKTLTFYQNVFIFNYMQRIRSFIAAILVFTIASPLALAISFTDTTGTPYATAFSYLSDRGIVQGYSDGSARPYVTLNRVESLKVILDADPLMAARVQFYKRHLPSLPLFADIDQRQWYAPYIEAAFAEGLITGYPDRTFRPANTLTTEESLALLIRAQHTNTILLASAITGAGSDAWYTKYVDTAASRNIFSPTEDLYIGEAITRGQFFDLLYKMDTVKQKGLKKFNGPTGRVPVESTGGIVNAPFTQPVYVRPTAYVSSPVIPVSTPVPVATVATAVESAYFAISMPSIDIADLKVANPSDPFTSKGLLEPLQNGVGHLFAAPGAGGKAVIYGHSSGYAWDVSKFTKVFRGINRLNIGDRVYVNYHGTVYTYEVTYKDTIPANDTTFAQGDGDELILYTCWPPDSIKQRYLVHAKRITE